jgi:hypothetical protein
VAPGAVLDTLLNTPKALARNTGGADEVDVYATRGRGMLTAAVEPPASNPFQGTDQAPDNPPAVTADDVGGQGVGCKVGIPGDQVYPEWASEQRTVAPDVLYSGDPQFNAGLGSEKLVLLQGVVLDSHIATQDMPLNHTVGAAGDIPRIHHDWNIHVRPDLGYQGVLPGEPANGISMLTDANIGAEWIEIEWELDPSMMSIDAVPAAGDRIAGIPPTGGRSTPRTQWRSSTGTAARSASRTKADRLGSSPMTSTSPTGTRPLGGTRVRSRTRSCSRPTA